MKSKAVPEYQAADEIDRVYHEIRQCLRVTGVNLNFRTWASFQNFLPAMWDGMRPNVQTSTFEQAAGKIRADAEREAAKWPSPKADFAADLGGSRAWQIRAALDLYHDINPKLLVFTSAVRMALEGEAVGTGQAAANATEQAGGEPDKMFAMEMEAERPDSPALRKILKDIQKTLKLSQINSDYRTLALWPDYLDRAWTRLKPICKDQAFSAAAAALQQSARELARALPYRYALDLRRVKELKEDPDAVLQTTRKFEQLLPGLILNIALLRRDWEQVREQPKLEPVRKASRDWREFQKRQRLVELDDRFVSYIDEGQGSPVLLIHGIPSWGFLWHDTIPALNKQHRVLAPDLPGFGYSEKRDCFDRSIGRQTDYLVKWMDALRLSRHMSWLMISAGESHFD